MSYDADRQTIEGLLNWTTTPVVWSGNAETPTSGDWIRVNMLNAESYRSAIHQQHYRHPGLLVIQIFVAKNSGNGVALRYGDTIAALYRGVTSGGIKFRAATVREIGPTEGWYQVNVEIPFERDEVY